MNLRRRIKKIEDNLATGPADQEVIQKARAALMAAIDEIEKEDVFDVGPPTAEELAEMSAVRRRVVESICFEH